VPYFRGEGGQANQGGPPAPPPLPPNYPTQQPWNAQPAPPPPVRSPTGAPPYGPPPLRTPGQSGFGASAPPYPAPTATPPPVSAATPMASQASPPYAPPPMPPPVAPLSSAPAAGADTGNLAVIYGGQRYAVNKDRFIIGRGQKVADLTIKDPNISRQHAMVELVGGQYFIVDMGSTNGIEHNGQRISRKPIVEGDVVRICEHEVRFTYR
jgi:hypothetical protein